MNGTARETAARLAEQTPETRDRYVDFLRALSIGVVVLGHWLMAIVTLEDGAFAGGSALEQIPGVWALTWVLQVMPLFFFVGGFANLVAWRAAQRRGDGYGVYLSGRLARLLRPTAVFIGTWVAASAVLGIVADTSGAGVAAGLRTLALPLWFLAVYVVVVAIAPAMLRLHERFGAAVPIAMAAGAIAVDALRIGAGVPWIGALNFGFVWLFAHQAGFFYGDGRLARLPRRAFAGAAVAGLAVMALLTLAGPYSPSMVGVADGKISNNSPPSVVLIAMSVWLIGLAMLARPAATRWLRSRRVWTGVVAANGMIMTAYLWHLTAMVLAAVVLLPLGFPQPDPGTAAWWATRPLWIGALAVALAGFAAVFGRFERPKPRPAGAPRPGSGSPVAAAAAVALISAGLAGFATDGFAWPDGLGSPAAGPLRNAAVLAAGIALLRARPRALSPSARGRAPRS